MTRQTEWLQALPFALLLFILPYPGTVALRLLCLSAAFMIAMVSWRHLNPPPLPCKPWLLLWAGLALISQIYAVEPTYSLGEIKNEIGYTMMVFVAFFAMTSSSTRLKWWILSVLLSCVVVAAWALLTGYPRGAWDDSASHGGVGSFASLAVLALPLVPLAWFFQSGRVRVMLAAGVLVMLLAAVLSEQRIIWVAFGLQLTLMLGLLSYTRLMRISAPTLALLVAICVTVAGVALLMVHERKVDLSPIEYYDLNHDFRLQQWSRILDRIEARPMTGAGFGRETMKKAYPDLVPKTPPLTLLWHPHNVFLTYGVAMGFPGMLALALVFGALFLRYARHLRDDAEEQRLIAIAGIALVAGIVVRNLTNDLFVRDGSLMFWAVNGGLLGLLTRRGQR